MTSMPTARQGLGVAVVDGKIYAIGGRDGVNEMYDPSSDTWTTKTPMPKNKAYFGIAAYENKIYCVGGMGEVQANFVYNTKTDSWASIADLPIPVWYICANIVDGKLYVMGGQLNNASTGYSTNANQVYNIATDSWTTATPLPKATQSYVSTVINGKIWVIGIHNEHKIAGDMQIYDPVNDSWAIKSGAWNPSSSGVLTSGVFAPQRFYQLGGTDGIFFKSWNKVYDPSNDSWSEGAAMPTARGWLGVAVVDDVIYAIGGKGEDINPTPPLATVERYIPFGYSNTPLVTTILPPTASANDNPSAVSTSTPTGGSSGDEQSSFPTTAIVAVAGAVIAVTGVTVYHFKHTHKASQT
ncbi:MAG: hypothetical protein NWF01_01270 [Candidatus Bathyarchaeota archaeon]|nr:hypothetical protein [Candidatus Bathyarchaeota archaeon]